MRKIWFFFAVLFLLIGLEGMATQSFILTSETTKILAQQSEKLERRRRFFEAIMGDEYKYPEKELPLHRGVVYGFLILSGIGFMHSLVFIKEKKPEK